MDFILKRTDGGLYGIFGTLVSEDGTESFVTLEHAYPDGKGGFVPKLAPGKYTCVRHDPVRLHYVTFMVQGVPPFQGSPVTGILLHIGNYTSDSEGCILIGKDRATGCILDSREAFEKFMEIQKSVDSFSLTVMG